MAVSWVKERKWLGYSLSVGLQNHVKTFFYYFYKKRVLTFFIFGNVLYSWNVIYFLVVNFFILLKLLKILLNLLNSCIKRL